MTETAYIALGSNLGDRFEHLKYAVSRLKLLAIDGNVACSSIYETAPVGPGVQDNYYNAVVSFSTSLEPEALLDACLEIEKRRGRVRLERWGPRTLDLDILIYGNEVLETDSLTLPHPRITERAFVLAPLCEIASGLYLKKMPLQEHFDKLGESSSAVTRLNELRLY